MFKSLQKILCLPPQQSKPKLAKPQRSVLIDSRASNRNEEDQISKPQLPRSDNSNAENDKPSWKQSSDGYWYGPVKEPPEGEGAPVIVTPAKEESKTKARDEVSSTPVSTKKRSQRNKVDQSSQTLEESELENSTNRPETIIESTSNFPLDAKRRHRTVLRKDLSYRASTKHVDRTQGKLQIQYCLTEPFKPPELNMKLVAESQNNLKWYDLCSEYREQFFPPSFIHVRAILDMLIPYIAFVILKHSGQTASERLKCLASVNYFLYSARDGLNQIFDLNASSYENLSSDILGVVVSLAKAKNLVRDLKKMKRIGEELTLVSENKSDVGRTSHLGKKEMFSYISKACGVTSDELGNRTTLGQGRRAHSEVKLTKPSLKNFKTFDPDSVFLIKRAISH